MDADVTLAHPDVPLKWLFDRWSIQEHTSMAIPWKSMEWRDNNTVSLDSRGLRVLNTGFVITQNSGVTLDMLEKWRDYTSETRYAGCAKWKGTWSHEQRAFSEYIRYDYNFTPETIVSIPCNNAVGWPGFKQDLDGKNYRVSDCNGSFVRHYTISKDKVKTAGTNSVMQVLSDALQRNLLGHADTMWVKEMRWEGQEQEYGDEREEDDGKEEKAEKEGHDKEKEREKTQIKKKQCRSY
jgi:hypothetical protein